MSAPAWWIAFDANVPGTPLSAPYRWGPYKLEADARVDSAFVQAENVRVIEADATADDWRFAVYPPGSSHSAAVPVEEDAPDA